jgi:chromosomal replication initiation ATPase DnaA
MTTETERKLARQLTLDLAGPPSYEDDDFLVQPANAAAHAMIERWPDWPERLLLLTGPAGSGKSHLAAMWARRAGAVHLSRTETLDPQSLGNPPRVVLEDCDRQTYPEAELFHLINRVREDGGALLATARLAPTLWGIRTPDLLSRLRLAPLVQIGRPDHALMRAVLAKLFFDRQIRIDEDVIDYAVRHCDESLEALRDFVEAVDQHSLAEGRRITRPLAARALRRDEEA